MSCSNFQKIHENVSKEIAQQSRNSQRNVSLRSRKQKFIDQTFVQLYDGVSDKFQKTITKF